MDASVNPKHLPSTVEWLSCHHFRYFWTVAAEGSLARAAEKLDVSQSSISEPIRELESVLGEKLFQREGRNKKLTEMGRIVLGYVEESFSLGRAQAVASRSSRIRRKQC